MLDVLTVEYLSIGNTRQVLEVFTGKGGLGLGRNFRYIDDLCFAQTRSVDSDSLVIADPLLTGVSLFVDAGGRNDPGFSVTLRVRIE